MDAAAVARVLSTTNYGIFKEPRGFIKAIEWVLAIFAFACCSGYSSDIIVQVTCRGGDNPIYEKATFTVEYPFDFSDSCITSPLCNATETKYSTCLVGEAGSSAIFFVFVGVMAFLYCIAAAVCYVFFERKMKENDIIPLADFVISAVFCILWLSGSAAWASDITDVKYWTSNSQVIDVVNAGMWTLDCNVISSAVYGSVNVSAIFGFLNLFVWCGNMWFLYKETSWFQGKGNNGEYEPVVD